MYEGKIDNGAVKLFMDTLPAPEPLDTAPVRVPEAMRDLPQPHHNSNMGHYPEEQDTVLEVMPTNWWMILGIASVVVIVIDGVIYYIWKRKKGTFPASSDGDNLPSAQSHVKSASNDSVSKCTISTLILVSAIIILCILDSSVFFLFSSLVTLPHL